MPVAMGSSPRVRGKAIDFAGAVEEYGIIPAGAGKSAPPLWRSTPTTDHPRGCGEKKLQPEQRASTEGSSPRVRGKAFSVRVLAGVNGIIPAGAGKRRLPQNGETILEDHPRGCGEKIPPRSNRPPKRGSSPRVRGKVSGAVVWGHGHRIIPAGAGKRGRGGHRHGTGQDHPRGCGEKNHILTPLFWTAGSSPRVRGKVGDEGHVRVREGIIPAGAGKSIPFGGVVPGVWDHPRGCGEKASFPRRHANSSGSSPRVRGKVGRGSLLFFPEGIIPAGAGKRFARFCSRLALADHPRGCGEKFFAMGLEPLLEGSSPRVRGKVGGAAGAVGTPLIIPAGAGKSR